MYKKIFIRDWIIFLFEEIKTYQVTRLYDNFEL